jgi:hypothetical protein
MGSGQVLMPKDAESNGTWIATSNCVFSLCILNGGFQNHVSQAPYAKSRGSIILDFFNYGDAQKMSEQHNWLDYEAFTLIVVKHVKDTIELSEIVWHQNQIYFKQLDATKPHIWSSSTLYSDAEKNQRQIWFHDFINNHTEPEKDDIIGFHHFAPTTNDAEGFVIDRKETGRKTVSLSNIHNQKNQVCSFYYKDFLNNKTESSQFFK